jgi:DNA replication ATP-dependent helicase Dna2
VSREEIHNAVLMELEKTAHHIDFIVESRKRIGALWSLTVEPTSSSQGGLDESLEGATAWWPGSMGQPNGAADILSVVSDEQLLNLRFASREPPESGQLIRVYPPQYLEALAEFWKNPALGEASLQWLDRAVNENTFDDRWVVPPDTVVPPLALRQHQLAALRLSGWNLSFLWGPPGTGKTYTLGVLVAGLLVRVPTARVLIVSTTNTAVDQVLVSVDKALEQLEQTRPEARTARRKCFRLGNHFIASNFENREHLLPVRDISLVQKLFELESSRPDESNVESYATWKSQIEQIRKEIKCKPPILPRSHECPEGWYPLSVHGNGTDEPTAAGAAAGAKPPAGVRRAGRLGNGCPPAWATRRAGRPTDPCRAGSS